MVLYYPPKAGQDVLNFSPSPPHNPSSSSAEILALALLSSSCIEIIGSTVCDLTHFFKIIRMPLGRLSCSIGVLLGAAG